MLRNISNEERSVLLTEWPWGANGKGREHWLNAYSRPHLCQESPIYALLFELQETYSTDLIILI